MYEIMSRIKSPINDGGDQRPETTTTTTTRTTTRNAMEIIQQQRQLVRQRRGSSPPQQRSQQMPPPPIAVTAHDRQSSISSSLPPGSGGLNASSSPPSPSREPCATTLDMSSFMSSCIGPLTRSRSKGDNNPFSTRELIQNQLFRSTESKTDREISDLIKDSTFLSAASFGGNLGGGGGNSISSWQHQFPPPPPPPPFALTGQRQSSLDWIIKSVDDPFKSTDSIQLKSMLEPSHVEVDYNNTFSTVDPSAYKFVNAPPSLQQEPDEPRKMIMKQSSKQRTTIDTIEATAPVKRGTTTTRNATAAALIKITKPKRKATKRRSTSSSDKNYINGKPTEVDVLCGRGGRTNHHPGNIYYLQMKEDIQERYLAASKEEKTAISQELVDAIHCRGGRFLKLDERSNHHQWYEIDNRTARKKASQTLREMNTPEYRAEKRKKYAK